MLFLKNIKGGKAMKFGDKLFYFCVGALFGIGVSLIWILTLNSAPFYLWVLVNALFLVIPAIILFVIGFVVKKKQ